MKTSCALCEKPAPGLAGYTVYTVYGGTTVYTVPSGLRRTTTYTDPQEHHYGVCRSCKTKWDVIIPLVLWTAATTLMLIGFGVGILGVAVIRPEWEFLWAGPGCLVPLIVLIVAVALHRQGISVEANLIPMAVSLRAEQGRKAGKVVDQHDEGVYRFYAGFNPRDYQKLLKSQGVQPWSWF